jgi:hypothetical protein
MSFRRIDAFVKSASGFEGEVGVEGGEREQIVAGNYTLGNCLFLKRFGEDYCRPKGWFGWGLGFFMRDKKETLPI